jgi:hypothetical protein
MLLREPLTSKPSQVIEYLWLAIYCRNNTALFQLGQVKRTLSLAEKLVCMFNLVRSENEPYVS